MNVDVIMLAYREPRIARAVEPWLRRGATVTVVVGGTHRVKQLGLPPVCEETDAALMDIFARTPGARLRVYGRTDRYWQDKNEMQRSAIDRCFGDIVWQVDADEHYLDEDVEAALAILRQRSDWELAAMGHVIFWKGVDRALWLDGGSPDGELRWYRPARIWRRKDGEHFMHLPLARIERKDGRVEEVEVLHLSGACYHTAWCDDARVRFRLDFHQARGDIARADAARWLETVWGGQHVPATGVHPMQHGIFPRPYDGPVPPELRP